VLRRANVLVERARERIRLAAERDLHSWPERDDDRASFLACATDMDRFIEAVISTVDHVRAKGRHNKRINLSFDEWNVWFHSQGDEKKFAPWSVAPGILEDNYTFEDALVVGCMLISLLKHADRVKIACLAQLVNVIAPIMTNANGLLRQTIYYPYSWALEFARGAALELLVESPAYDVSGMGAVGYVDAAGTYQADTGKIALFLLNRDLAKPHEVEIVWEGASPRVGDAVVLTGSDLKASNTFEAPTKVTPQKAEKPSATGVRTTFALPPDGGTATTVAAAVSTPLTQVSQWVSFVLQGHTLAAACAA